MFPMAMPPHFGGGLPPLSHSTMYSPHLSNNNTVHTSKPFPAPSGNQHVYSPNQMPMYISSYNSSIGSSSIPRTQQPPTHSQSNMSQTLHSNNYRSSYPAQSFRHDQYRELSNAATASSRELFEKIEALHLGYIETEDSPQKMEQRHKMEETIHEFLGITPHSFKFSSIHVKEVLENSINRKPDFDPHKAGCAFDALAQFAANLIVHPWRKEFRELKLYSGFWVHHVGSHLLDAESILEQMGFTGIRPKATSSQGWTGGGASCYVHSGVVDPDLICGIALDCMIAYCECQVLKRIREGVAEYGISIQQILQFRQVYIGDIEVSRRHLQYTARQKIHAASQNTSATENLLNLSSSPPPIPSRQNSSFSATTSMNHYSKRTPASSPSEPYHPQSNNLAQSSSKSKAAKTKGETTVDSKRKPTTLNLKQISESSSSHARNRSSQNDNYSSMLRSAMNSCQVPTAKLIDIDTSHESSYRTSSKHHLPKTIPHKSSRSHHSSREILNEPDISTSDPISPEVFKPRTLDEHLEASLNIAKNASRTRSKQSDPKSSLETWDFVYKNLEKKGYVKDIGDRGDILNEFAKQNDTHRTSHKTSKNRPVTIPDSKPEPKSVEKAKRLSTYDNVQESETRLNETPSRREESDNKNTWSCSACTFFNPESLSICDMCGKSRTVTNDTLQSGGKQCGNCTLINDREAVSCSVCSHTLVGCSTYI